MNLTRRDWLAGSAVTVAALPFLETSSALASEAPSALPLRLVHPDLRALMPMIAKFGAMSPPLSRATLAEARKPNPVFNQPPMAAPAWERRLIPVGRPHPDVAIYVVNAKPGTSRPAILHTHGGGYIIGSAESSVRQLQELCAKLDCVAVSVDYRLAPETTYAGSIEDNYAGLKWLHAHAAELGADPAKIAIMGESAGGGHAALLAITARDRGEVPVCFQCLIYPMLDDRTGTSRSVKPWVGTIIWDAKKNRLGWECFLGMVPGGKRSPVAGVPSRNPNLAGLPPAFIAVGTLDLFCDEDVDYAQRLNNAGVPAEIIVVPGAFHGFDGIAKMANVPLGTWFENTKLNALRRGFGIAAI